MSSDAGRPVSAGTQAATAAGKSPALEVWDITKTYGPVKALQPTSFALQAGEVHALVGENGSGKSTVVGILSGAVRPDSGTVRLGEIIATDHTPWESQRAGTLTVFQDGSLISGLTVAQNLYLGIPPSQRPAYRRIETWSRDRLQEFGLGRVSPGQLVDSLASGDRQLLDIVRALMARPSVLLLDEATSALDAAGVDLALGLIREAAERGTSVLFVSHRLSEVFRIADRISVLRDGDWQGTFSPTETNANELVELMAGTAVDVEFPPRAAADEIGEAMLTAQGLTGPGFGPVDLGVRAGEILGIAGADGNGQLALLSGLTGVDMSGGRLIADSSQVTSLAGAVRAKIAYLSSDRRAESLFPSLPIRENLVVGVLRRLSTLGFVSPRAEQTQTERSVRDFSIRVGSVEDPVTSLSGGNQQKVALGRVLATDSRIILIDEPTQGVDVRSRIDIYRMLRAAARDGKSVVVVSTDASELAGLCDRIVVMSRGTIVAEMHGETASEAKIIHAFTRAKHAAAVSDADAVAGGGPDLPVVEPTRRFSRQRELLRLHQDAGRLGLLVVMLIALSGYVETRNGTFFTTPSIYNVLLLTLPLAVVAGAEFLVIFTGGIDVSVGGTMGVTVAVMSFLVQKSGAASGIVISVLLAIGIGTAVGLVNALLVERVKISPVIATIAMLGILQGLGLILRPQAAGSISLNVSNALTEQVGPIPAPLFVVAILFVLADLGINRTGRGLRLRAIGLNPLSAYRLGANASRLRQLSYVGCAILAALAGVLLAAQVGVGDSTVGTQYTLLAVAAPIIGGASLLGGRGSFVGCLVGSLLLALALTLPTVLSLSDGTGYLLAGGLTLLALLVYTNSAWATIARWSRMLRTRLRGRATDSLARLSAADS
jgi:ribose transport system permease protein/ribose transport system ATP-binding protein